MAENSAFWLGSTLGDAASTTGWKGAYSDTDINDIHSRLLANDDNQGFVIPNYNNNLRVHANAPAAMNVLVETGAAFMRGKIYENTAQNTLTISANASGNPRIDRIIIRMSFAAQTIRLAVLDGTPAATPALPTLTQTAAIYEVALAYIWVANGAASIVDTDIHTEREFFNTYASINDYYGAQNRIINSEFMSFSEWAAAGGANIAPPDKWELVASPTAIVGVTAPTQMSRGRAIQITTNAASEGISQTHLIKASTTYCIKLLTWVTAGDVGSIVVTTNSGSPGTMTRYTRRTGEWVEEKIFYTTEADATTLTIQLLCLNSTDVVRYGQVLLVEGFSPGPFRQISEIITTTNLFLDANWNSSNKSTGTTTIDLSVDYGGYVLAGTKAIFGTITTFETVSTATDVGLRVRYYGTSLNLVVTNNKGMGLNVIKRDRGFVPLDNRRMDFNVSASGVNSLTTSFYIWGIAI